jgi:pimeloyl-ACP methyl ester carboxylesterase
MPSAALPSGPHIEYSDQGAGGSTVVLSHGFMLDRTMFAAQVAALAREHRVITWDARGHGGTIDDGTPFGQSDSARDLLALLDHLDVQRAVLGGMSQGGAVTLSAALLDPARVAGIVLISTTPHAPDGEAFAALQALGSAWRNDGPADGLCQMFAQMMFGQGDAAAWIAKWKALGPGEFDHRFGAVLRGEDLSLRLGEITAPALVIHGGSDAGIPVAQAEHMAQTLPGSGPPVILGGAPHGCNITHADEVNDAMLSFLSHL